MKAKQLREAIKSTLSKCNLPCSEDLLNLLVGTACVESNCGEYIKQINGPACGIFQIEPNTAKDIQENYIKYKPDLRHLHDKFYLKGLTLEENLMYNLSYSILMCRLFYRRIKEPIPKTISGQAAYWKKYYNTHLGKGTIEDYINKKEKLDV